MALYDLRFVDTIATAPTVRLDLRSTPFNVQLGTEFGMPELRRSATSTLLVDGERYPAAAYGNRVITLVVQVKGVTDDATATALQRLYRELDRPSNVLLYRPGTSKPVFFRTFRTGPSAVTWDPIQKQVTVRIPAEPFALGLVETLSPPAVTNDPATGSNGLYIDLTGIKGDVETPLYLSFPRAWALATGGETSGRKKTLVAVRRRGTPSAAPLALQAESMTLGTDTSAASPSGASGTARRTSFADPAMRSRLTADPFPAAAGVDVQGTYRVFARVAAGDTASTHTIGLRWGSSDYTVINNTVTIARTATTWYFVDLGLVQMPPGLMSTDSVSGAADPVRGIRVELWAGRTAGAAALDWDYVVFVPADDRLMLAEWPFAANASVTDFVLDPVAEAGYARDGSAVRYAVEPIGVEGGMPMVSPGVTNRLYVVRDVGGWASGTSDTVTASATVGAWYYPRYLYVRPATT